VPAVALAAGFALGVAPSAQANTNLIPNPGFELLPSVCGGTPVCYWTPFPNDTTIRDTTNPHSETASMQVTGPGGEVDAGTSGFLPPQCALIAPGLHQASFWYRTSDAVATLVAFVVHWWPSANCTGAAPSSELIVHPPELMADGAWHLVSGTLTAPMGTGSANFVVGEGCTGCQETLTVNFDDVDLEGEVLAVTVSSFGAVRSHKGVVVRWRTGSEVDTLGFNVYRARHGRRVRLNRRLIPALSLSRSGVSGGAYTYVDRHAPRHAAVRYWLQEVDTAGQRTWHGPVRVGRA
jgi:hypothetical protein